MLLRYLDLKVPSPKAEGPRFQRWTFLSILGNLGSWPGRLPNVRAQSLSVEASSVWKPRGDRNLLQMLAMIPCVCLTQVSKKICNRPGIGVPFCWTYNMNFKSTNLASQHRHLVVSSNGDTPQWMVSFMEKPTKMDEN